MAELIGSVAGGAGLLSLALQLGESAQKMRRLHRDYKHAPQFLSNLSAELDTFALTLYIIEHDHRHHSGIDSELTQRCIQTSHRACDEIRSTIVKLEDSMSRSTSKGKLKVAFDMPSMEQRRLELDRAKQSLAFAHQLYSEALHRQTEGLLIERLDALRLSPDFHSNKTAQARTVSRSERSDLHFEARLASDSTLHPRATVPFERRQFKPWFFSRLWVLSYRLTMNSFGLNITTFNIVPDNSPVFEYCRLGMVDQVRSLFEQGRASPYDCSYTPDSTISGTTVLAAAAESGNLELCTYLISHAGFPPAPARTADPVDAYALSVLNGRGADWKHAYEMYSLLLRESRFITDDFILNFCAICRRAPDLAILRLIRSRYQTEFESATTEAKVELAMITSSDCRAHLPEVFLDMLNHSAVNAATVRAYDAKGRSPLHMIAERACQLYETKPYKTWIEFVRQLLQHGANLHQEDAQGRSPLLYLLEESIHLRRDPARTWAQLLHEAGVDLQSYGQHEMQLWQKMCPHGIKRSWHDVRVKTWHYGAQANEWFILRVKEASIPVYEVDSAERIPGAWPTEFSPPTTTICWQPSEKDELAPSWRWRHVKDIAVFSEVDISAQGSDVHYDGDDDLLLGLDGPQDDCSACVWAIQDSSRLQPRPRSHSQPRGLSRIEGWGSTSGWWPMAHRCTYDGRRRFGFELDHDGRLCAEGMHDLEYETWFERMTEELKRFRYRYQDRNELAALPYSAYRHGWVAST